jgi:hypothetical protein
LQQNSGTILDRPLHVIFFTKQFVDYTPSKGERQSAARSQVTRAGCHRAAAAHRQIQIAPLADARSAPFGRVHFPMSKRSLVARVCAVGIPSAGPLSL